MRGGRLAIQSLRLCYISALKALALLLKLTVSLLLLLHGYLVVLVQAALKLVRKVSHRCRRWRICLAQIDKPWVMPSEGRAIIAYLAASRASDSSALVLLHRVADRSVRSDIDRVAVSRVDHVPSS